MNTVIDKKFISDEYQSKYFYNVAKSWKEARWKEESHHTRKITLHNNLLLPKKIFNDIRSSFLISF